MPTLEQIQKSVGSKYIVDLEFNMAKNQLILVIRDDKFTKNVSLPFTEKEMNIEEYKEKILNNCIEALNNSHVSKVI